MKAQDMSEPISTSVGAAFGFKALGGAAGAIGLAAAFATIVVILKTLPGTFREWATAIISTVVASLGLGAFATIKLGLLVDIITAPDDLTLFFRLIQLFGVVFACGLPGWFIVRLGFTYMDKNKDRDPMQIYDEVKAKL